ncbi:MAG: 4Fe-4S binding protein [Treponema sp.]|jgi:NAD-dependent dihydropyrimidine dehydrogenase PreA subunit|nr:4Fe-4S binding protein [Treponema sp.]
MIRQIIKIDEEKCIGCTLCVSACREGAIGMKDGKAVLLKEDYCDGLGNCLPVCPAAAISFEKREALEFSKTEVKKNMDQMETLACGCPGADAKEIKREESAGSACCPTSGASSAESACCGNSESQLRQWPIQINLVPVNAPYFENAKLLVAADCAAYAYADFHDGFMKNKITLIGCPKQDTPDRGNYSDKLTAIIKSNNIKSVTVVRIECPCCAGIENSVIKALKNSGKMLPWQSVTVTTDGRISD